MTGLTIMIILYKFTLIKLGETALYLFSKYSCNRVDYRSYITA